MERPKYKQIIQQVIDGIREGELQRGDELPSINEVCERESVCRDTVVKSYDVLQERGLIEPVHGKGFYVSVDEYRDTIQTFLLFDRFSDYKEIVYQQLQETAGSRAELDLYFHHRDRTEFRRLIEEALGSYQYYLVMPPTNPGEDVYETLQLLDEDRLLLLDIPVNHTDLSCACIVQNFRQQFRGALRKALERLQSYDEFVLVYPADNRHPVQIKGTFQTFCSEHLLPGTVVSSLKDRRIRPGYAYLVIEDQDLVHFMKYAQNHDMEPGREAGIISYNDTPFKEIIGGGITVISTDFQRMGQLAGEQILERRKRELTVMTRFLDRGSL